MLLNDPYVKKSTDWLLSIQNKDDGGWGMYEYHPSRIVNTAEAVTGLALAGVNKKQFQKGLDYLIESGKDENWCQYTRHHAWTVYALSIADLREEIPERCIEYLLKYQINGGWSQLSTGVESLYSTFLAARSLFEYGEVDRIPMACDWIINKFQDNYWTHSDNKKSLSATSYALLILSLLPEMKLKYEEIIRRSTSFLTDGLGGNWPIEHESKVSGDQQYNFHHNSLPWTIMALLSVGESIFKGVLPHLIEELYFELYQPDTGGWSDEKNHRPTVYATSHTISTIYSIHRATTIQELTNIVSDCEDSKFERRKEIFIIHGHDELTKLTVSNFLNEINCTPVILADQIDTGTTTIFQKFLHYSSISSYAIALLTPDDTSVDKIGKTQMRSRQNVILELGYFLGKLGPERVCILRKGNLEIPSDIGGVLYLDVDNQDWKYQLSRRLYKLGFNIYGQQ